jgi:hypothetical protein
VRLDQNADQPNRTVSGAGLERCDGINHLDRRATAQRIEDAEAIRRLSN